MGKDQDNFTLKFSKTSYGTHAPITISFCITSIGTPEEPEYDCYPVEFQIPSEKKKLYFPEWEFSADDKTFRGDNEWVWFGDDDTVLRSGDPEDEDPDYFEVTFEKIQLRTFVEGEPMGIAHFKEPGKGTGGGLTMMTENWRYD